MFLIIFIYADSRLRKKLSDYFCCGTQEGVGTSKTQKKCFLIHPFEFSLDNSCYFTRNCIIKGALWLAQLHSFKVLSALWKEVTDYFFVAHNTAEEGVFIN